MKWNGVKQTKLHIQVDMLSKWQSYKMVVIVVLRWAYFLRLMSRACQVSLSAHAFQDTYVLSLIPN